MSNRTLNRNILIYFLNARWYNYLENQKYLHDEEGGERNESKGISKNNGSFNL